MNNVVRGNFAHRSRSPVDSGNTPTGGDGGDNNVLERVARLESDVEYIKRDIAELKSDLKAFRAESAEDSKSVSEEFKSVSEEFKLVRSEMQDGFKSVSEEFKQVRAEMRADFRLLFWAIITVTLGLAGLMAKGFGWL